MGKIKIFILIIAILKWYFFPAVANDHYSDPVKRRFNVYYTGKNLDHVAFPIEGIGAGMFCMDVTVLS